MNMSHIDDFPLEPERIRAIAAQKVSQLAEKMNDPELIQDCIRAYLRLVPVKEIAQEMKEKHPHLFQDESIGIIAGAIRVQLRENMEFDERKAVEFEHRSRKGKKHVDAKIGIFGVTEAEIKERAKKGGKATVERKIGIFGFSDDEKKRTVEKARAASLAARGLIPWIEEGNEESNGLNELDYFLYLTKQPEFLHQSGTNKGKNDIQKIAHRLNVVFHNNEPVRKAKLLSMKILKLKAKLKKSSSKEALPQERLARLREANEVVESDSDLNDIFMFVRSDMPITRAAFLKHFPKAQALVITQEQLWKIEAGSDGNFFSYVAADGRKKYVNADDMEAPLVLFIEDLGG